MVIKGEEADAVVVDQALDYLDTEKLAKAIERARNASGNRDLATLIERLEKDRARLHELDDAYADGEIDRPEYKRLTDRLTKRIAENERALSKVAAVPDLTAVRQGAKLRKAWAHLSFEEQRDVLAAVLERVDVLPAQKPVNRFSADRLQVTFRY